MKFNCANSLAVLRVCAP